VSEELKHLTEGVSGVTVAGFSEPQVLRALVVHFKGDMHAGDKLLSAIGGNGEYPGRSRFFAGVRLKNRYCCPPYAPDTPHPSKRRRFDVSGNTKPRRTASSIVASSASVEDARAAEQIKAAVRMLAQKKGIN